MNAREEVEFILNRALYTNEIDELLEKTDVIKMLVWVLTSKRPLFVIGHDAATLKLWLGLSMIGRHLHVHGVDWICVPHLSGLLMPVPGIRVTDELFLQFAPRESRSVQWLIWVPTGALITESPHAGAVRRNAPQIADELRRFVEHPTSDPLRHSRILSLCGCPQRTTPEVANAQ